MIALVEGINRFADAWWFWTLHAAWQSAVVGCIILAVVACARRWPAPARYWLLVIALLKFAMPPLWSAPTGLFSRIPVATNGSSTTPASANRHIESNVDDASPAAPSSTELNPPEQSPTATASHGPLSEVVRNDRIGLADTVGPATNVHPAAVAAAPHSSAFDVLAAELTWKSVLLAVQALGTLGILAWIAVQFGSVRRIVGRARPIESGPIAESLGRVGRRIVLPRSARVLVSPDVASPLATGAWRPTVVLPNLATELPSRELDAVLVHELTHLRRGDAWLAWAQVLLCAAWWFHPVIWLVNRSLRRVREDCCDDAILLSGVASGSEYCDILLRVARDATARHADLLACHMAGRLHPLGDRMRRIMDTRVRRWRRTPLAAAAAVIVLACVALPGLGRTADRPTPSVEFASNERAGKNPPPTAEKLPDPLPKPVREAIARARAFLAAQQNGDGSFFNYNSEADGTAERSGGKLFKVTSAKFPVATTSFALLALLNSGSKPDDPAIVNGVESLRTVPDPSLYIQTFENSMRIVALVAVRQWDHDRGRITALVRSLEDNQIRKGAHAGMWNVGRGDLPGDEDNSDTRYAVWGLYEAARAGVPVKRETWERAAQHFTKYQNRDGGWGRRNSSPSTGNMTCGGIASLLLCDRMLTRETPEPKDANASARAHAIKSGIDWLTGHFTVGINPPREGTSVLDYLAGMARVGRLLGDRHFRTHDWYREGAAFLVEGEAAQTGSWQAGFSGLESDPRVATSLALLFLSSSGSSDVIKLNARPLQKPPTTRSPASEKSEKPVAAAMAAVPPIADPFAQKVQAAIGRGRLFLTGAQNPDGSFEFRDSEPGPLMFAPGSRPQETGNPPGYLIGTTSLALLALLDAGEKPDARVITKGLDFLRNAPATATYFSTYENSLEIAALVAAKTGERDRGRITALVRALEKNQLRRGGHAGMWNYGERDQGSSGDNSNTQFALWGLHTAALAGIPVQRETWERSADHFVAFQNNDGGWGYRNGSSSTGSMTCGAIASLALCNQMLLANRPPAGQITPGDGDEKQPSREIALKRGIAWVSRYFKVGINPGQGGQWALYYLFEMSRAGRLSGQARFGSHDWYHEAAGYLLDGQSPYDGSWQTSWGAPASTKTVATSFALLVLSATPSTDQAFKVNDTPPHGRSSGDAR